MTHEENWDVEVAGVTYNIMEKDRTVYFVYCDEDGEWEEVEGKEAALNAAQAMLERYRERFDMYYNCDEGGEVDDCVVGIYKLDTEVRLVTETKCYTMFSSKKEVFTNGIRK